VARDGEDPGYAGVRRDEPYRDFQFEIDARLTEPLEAVALLLFFRVQSNDDTYVFEIRPDLNRIRLLASRAPGPTTLMLRGQTTALLPGVATNRIGVRAQGMEFTALINGQEVARARDGTFPEGFLGFGVANRQGGPAEGWFSNLAVTALE
jgi:hypothetical protein